MLRADSSLTAAPVGIVGNGAIGNLLAWHCEQNQVPYCLFPREPKPFALQITTLDDAEHQVTPDVASLTAPPALRLLVLPLKAYQIQAALQSLPSDLSRGTPIMLLHNGMGTLAYVDNLFPDNPVLVSTTSMGAMKSDTHHCKITGQGHSAVGWHRGKPQDDRAWQRLVEILLPGAVWHVNIQQALWDKLAINAVINPLTAAFEVKNGELLAPDFEREITQLCEETARVMNGLGLHANPQQLVENVRNVCRNTAHNRSSMLQDVLHHRPTELAFISGHLLNEAAGLGIPCPAHQAAVARLT